jgi:16S rRNA (guanine966-N2)-methyltransferase
MRRAAPAAFELVLLDPPFDAGLAGAALAAARPLVVPGGWLYLEAAAPVEALPAGLREHRRLRAGAVSAQLLQVD